MTDNPACCEPQKKFKHLPYSPFEYRCDISAVHYVKMFILSFILFPIRALLSGSFFLMVLGLSNIIAPAVIAAPTSCVRDRKRQLLMPIILILARLVYLLGGVQWITIKGDRAPRSEAPILIVGPHTSYLDSLAVVVLGMPSCVVIHTYAKAFIGGIIRVLRPILVDRYDPQSRKKTLDAICTFVNSKTELSQLFIFPEGTCTNGTSLVTFRQGGFQPGLPVQPVLLRWKNKVDTTSWVWIGPTVFKLLWMTMTQFNTWFEIEFLPVYKPNAAERNNPQLYANNVRKYMAEALQVPTCDLTYEDFCRMQIAADNDIPNPEAVANLHALLRSVFSFKPDDTDEAPYSRWVHTRLMKMLKLAQHSPQVSYRLFVDALFPGVCLSERETLLVQYVREHYSSESSLTIDLRRFMSQACMLLFFSEPTKALRYAAQIFPETVHDQSDQRLNAAAATEPSFKPLTLNVKDTQELLRYVFSFNSDNELDQMIILTLGTNCESSNCSVGSIQLDQLCSVLSNEIPNQFMSYSTFQSKLFAKLGKRGSPPLLYQSTNPISACYSNSIARQASKRESLVSMECGSVKPVTVDSLHSRMRQLAMMCLPRTPSFRANRKTKSQIPIPSHTCSEAHRLTSPNLSCNRPFTNA